VIASEDFSWRNFSVEWFCFDLLQYQHPAAYFSFLVFKIQIQRDSIHFFQRSFDLRIPMDDGVFFSFVLSFIGFTVGPVVEVGESSARVWPFGTRC
jgi:hypothetical protein